MYTHRKVIGSDSSTYVPAPLCDLTVILDFQKYGKKENENKIERNGVKKAFHSKSGSSSIV